MRDTVINGQDYAIMQTTNDMKSKKKRCANITNGLYLPLREVKKRHFCFFAGTCWALGAAVAGGWVAANSIPTIGGCWPAPKYQHERVIKVAGRVVRCRKKHELSCLKIMRARRLDHSSHPTSAQWRTFSQSDDGPCRSASPASGIRQHGGRTFFTAIAAHLRREIWQMSCRQSDPRNWLPPTSIVTYPQTYFP